MGTYRLASAIVAAAVVACVPMALDARQATDEGAAAPAQPAAQQPAARRPAARTPAAGTKAAAKTPSSPAFDALVKEAAAARDARRLDEAVALYTKAVKQRPSYAEGYWYLGMIDYERDRYEPARAAFRRVTDLAPANGSAWALKGLCEFNLKNYETALSDLVRARQVNFGGDRQIVEVARYHMAILLNRVEEYEAAIKLLNEFAQEGNDGPRIIEAYGIAALRLPQLPSEVPGAKRALVMMAGRAQYFSGSRLVTAAQTAFEALVQRYPETANVHYAFGVFLVNEQPDKAIEQFEQELAISPRHPLAKLQIAFEYIRRAEWDTAKTWAQQAVDEAPTNFAARKALGQVLLETGDIEGAIRELEAGVRIAPDSPPLHFTLASAYRRAGRKADAEREQAEFTRLDRELRTQRTGIQSIGGMGIETDDAGADAAGSTPQ